MFSSIYMHNLLVFVSAQYDAHVRSASAFLELFFQLLYIFFLFNSILEKDLYFDENFMFLFVIELINTLEKMGFFVAINHWFFFCTRHMSFLMIIFFPFFTWYIYQVFREPIELIFVDKNITFFENKREAFANKRRTFAN